MSHLLLAQRLVQSTVTNKILVLVLQHALFNSPRETWMTWVTWSQAIRLSEGRGQSSCRHLQLPGSSEQPKTAATNAQHITEEISTFHQKEVSSWMACDKKKKKLLLSHQWWVIFFKKWWQLWKLIACIHHLHLISCSLFPTKVRFLRVWWQE